MVLQLHPCCCYIVRVKLSPVKYRGKNNLRVSLLATHRKPNTSPSPSPTRHYPVTCRLSHLNRTGALSRETTHTRQQRMNAAARVSAHDQARNKIAQTVQLYTRCKTTTCLLRYSCPCISVSRDAVLPNANTSSGMSSRLPGPGSKSSIGLASATQTSFTPLSYRTSTRVINLLTCGSVWKALRFSTKFSGGGGVEGESWVHLGVTRSKRTWAIIVLASSKDDGLCSTTCTHRQHKRCCRQL